MADDVKVVLSVMIAATAVAALTASGLFVHGQAEKDRRAADLRRAAQAARARLFQLADARTGDNQSLRAWCQTVEHLRGKEVPDNEDTRAVLGDCRKFGYL